MSFAPAPLNGSGLPQNQMQLILTQATRLYEALPGGGKLDISGLDPVPGGVAVGGARAATALLLCFLLPTLPRLPNFSLGPSVEKNFSFSLLFVIPLNIMRIIIS